MIPGSGWVRGRERIMRKTKPYFFSNSRANIKCFPESGWVRGRETLIIKSK